MADNTNKLNTQLNFAIPTTQEEREKIIFLAVKILTEKEGGNITLNQLLSYVDDNINNLSNEVAQALINKSDNGHKHDDRYYTEDEVNTKVNELKSDLINQLYPVGAIYISLTDECSPANFIPTSQWEKLPEGKALWTTSSGAGETIDAGLPNIVASVGTGNFDYRWEISYPFYLNNNKTGPEIVPQEGFLDSLIEFDLSKANPIYRNDCTTVQPPAYKVYAWKRIA